MSNMFYMPITVPNITRAHSFNYYVLHAHDCNGSSPGVAKATYHNLTNMASTTVPQLQLIRPPLSLPHASWSERPARIDQ